MEKEKLSIDEKPDWESFKSSLEEKNTKAWNLAKEKMGAKGMFWMQEKIVGFTGIIREKIPDYGKFIAWHVLAGSTTIRDTAPNVDFPAPYSAGSFLDSLLDELEKR
jgi:hypothetical protein